ncbi:MAG TPA: TIGR00730 family Rossman fold protein [Micromonosporaceae bacterium]
MAAIGVFCASSRTIDDGYLDLAYAVGAELARRGHTLVSGGGCVSMMGAVADGARSGGAHTFGVMPEKLVTLEIADSAADELVVTSDMAERKTIMMAKSDAFLTLPGGIGTLDELFEVWTTAALRLHAKPCVVLDHDGFYAGLFEWLRGRVTQGFVRADALDLLRTAGSVPGALDAIETALG